MIRARAIGFNACDVRIVNAALSEKLLDDLLDLFRTQRGLVLREQSRQIFESRSRKLCLLKCR